LNVTERVDDLRGRIDLLELDLNDQDARAIFIERALHQVEHGLFDLLTALGQDRLQIVAADFLAHGAFGDGADGAFRVLDVEQEVGRAARLHLPDDGEVHVDDVLVAGQHQAFLRHFAHADIAAGGGALHADADFETAILRHIGDDDALDGIRQMIVQAFTDRADMLAETQHDALLARLDLEPAGKTPDGQQHDEREEDALLAREETARHDLAETVLTTAQKLVDIGRTRAATGRTAAPPARIRTPRATAAALSTPG